MNLKEQNRRRYELAKPAYDALMKFYPFNVDDLQGEQWRPVIGYEVSNYGRVKTFKRGKAKIKKTFLRNCYLSVNLWKDGKQKNFQVHRLVAEAFIDNPDMKSQVNHIDGNKMNNFVGNLEWATCFENIHHAVDTGLSAQGGESSQAKLTDEQAEYIRNNPDKLTQKQLAGKFGVTVSVINYIQLGKTYKNAGGSIRKAQKFGEYHRIPDEIRAAIRADWATGNYTKAALARKYGVSQTTIWNILNGH